MTTRPTRRFLTVAAATAAVGGLLLALSAPTSVSAASAPNTKAKAAAGQTGRGGEGRGPRGGFLGGASLDAAAKALGMTTEALTKELVAGKSIADVAATKKVSVDTVVNAIQAAMRPQIVEMVNMKGLAGPGRDGRGGRDGAPGQDGGAGGGTGSGTGEALKTCLKSKGVDPSKVPTDQASKDARAKALKECVKAA
jgi:hypothetical protein